MIKFILDAMYYQIFIFNRDKFILENISVPLKWDELNN